MLVERLKIVLYSNDCAGRQLTLRVLGELAPLSAESTEVVWQVLARLGSVHAGEQREAARAAERLCRCSREAAEHALPRLLGLLGGLRSADREARAAAARALASMGHSWDLALQAQLGGEALLTGGGLEAGLADEVLRALTVLGVRCPATLRRQAALLWGRMVGHCRVGLLCVERLLPAAARLAARRREKGFTLSKRGELAVLDELARAMPQGGLELAEPACWGAAASNAVVARGRGAAARLRWLALARRAVAASWCFLSFEEFVQSHADAVEGRRRALRDAPISVAQPTGPEPAIVDAVNLAVLPISQAAAPRPLPDGTFTWTTPEEDESVPVDEAPPAKPSVKGAEGKALSRFESVFPVVVAAIPQIVSVHVVGSSEEDVWRVVRSTLTDDFLRATGLEAKFTTVEPKDHAHRRTRNGKVADRLPKFTQVFQQTDPLLLNPLLTFSGLFLNACALGLTRFNGGSQSLR